MIFKITAVGSWLLIPLWSKHSDIGDITLVDDRIENGVGVGSGIVKWDGKVNGQLLPDGECFVWLRCMSGCSEYDSDERTIRIDTTRPRMEFAINGRAIKPDGTAIINDVTPQSG